LQFPLDKDVICMAHTRRRRSKGKFVSVEEFNRLCRPDGGGTFFCEACREYKEPPMHVLLTAHVTLNDGVRTQLHPTYYVCPSCYRKTPSMHHSLTNMDLARGRDIFEVFDLCGHGTNATEAATVANVHTDATDPVPSGTAAGAEP
jgi:hypothetical protein